MRSSTFILPLHLLCLIVLTTSCPSVCVCKWKGGKISVECLDQGFSSIPENINTEAQLLDLTGNRFTILFDHMFQEKGLVNLQKVYLTRCGIHQINPAAFSQLTNLVELDLSENKLDYIPVEPFIRTPHLRRLILSYNAISFIPEDSFVHLHKLTMLDLGNNAISYIHPRAFSDLVNLELLKINRNRLTSLSVDTLQPLVKLTGLQLNSNPWLCDCFLKKVRLWMLDNNVPLGIPPTCQQPLRLADSTWELLELNEFACMPNVSSESQSLLANEGDNVTLFCKIIADPPGKISWASSTSDNSSVTQKPYKYVIKENDYGSSLTILNISAEEDTLFTCTGSNEAGASSLNFTIQVALKPQASFALSNRQLTGIVLATVFCFLLFVIIAALVCARKSLLVPGQNSKLRNLGLVKVLGLKKSIPVDATAKGNIHENPVDKVGSNDMNLDPQTPDLLHDKMNLNGPINSNRMPSDFQFSEDAIYKEKPPIDDQWSLQKAHHAYYDDYTLTRMESPQYPDVTYHQRHSDFSPNYGTVLRGRAQYYNPFPPSNKGDAPLSALIYPSAQLEKGNSPSAELVYPRGSHHLTWKRSPIVLPNTSHFVLHPAQHVSASPDEGYAEEPLEGTEV